jgi:hypothetical protein
MTRRASQIALALTLGLAAAGSPLRAQGAPAATSGELQVTLQTGGQEWVRRDGTVELVLSRWPAAGEGRLAVLLGPTDVTDLFAQRGSTLVYRPELLPLPPGQHEIVVYLVTPQGAWREIGRFPLRVLRPGGVETATLTPRLDLNLKGQLDEHHEPADNAPPRSTYQDGTSQLDLQATATRGGWTIAPAINVMGVTYRPEALRYSLEGDDAPQVDLSSYGLRLSRGRGWVHLGHLTYGDHKYLVTGFNSRGAELYAPLGKAVDVTLTAANGTQIVGWDNPLGLEEQHHRIYSGKLGFELLPSRAGALRVEATYLDGSVLPQFGFNSRDVNDAEESDGWGARLLGSNASQRLRFEGGYASSTFTNPESRDPQLTAGLDVVPVRPERRDARYGSLTLGLLQKTWQSGKSANVNLTVRHDRVEPLFRTVATYVQADRQEDAGELQANLGPLAIQGSYTRNRDNLDGIPTILTTKTRRSAANLALPLAQLGKGDKPRPWLPQLTYTFDRTHQFGEGVPPDSGFSASHVPDQVSLQQSVGVDWQGSRWRFGWRTNLSDQDNRQIGRERADLYGRAHMVTLGFTPWQPLDVTLDGGFERNESEELQRVDETRRLGLNLLWRITERMTVTAIGSRTRRSDEPRTQEGEDWSADVQWAWRFEKRREQHGWSGQIFLRWYDQESDAFDRVFFFDTHREGWTLTSGVNFSLF